MKTLELADENKQLTIALTGDKYETGISELKYIQDYSIKYHLLGENASGIRSYLRRNGRSNSDNVEFMRLRLMKIEALREHMRKQEDGLIGKLLSKDKQEGLENLVKHFDLKKFNVGKKPSLYRNITNDVQYIYSESYHSKGKWEKTKAVYGKGSHILRQGNHVILKNPLRFDPLSKEEILDAYSLLLVTGDITPENIRGFSGSRINIINFMSESMKLKSQISALSAEAFRLSKNNPESSQNWIVEKDAELELVEQFFEKHALGIESLDNIDKIDKDITLEDYAPTVQDIALYLMKPSTQFGRVTYIKDKNVALPTFKVNKRVASVVLRYLRNNGHEDIYNEIVEKWGTQFKRRYSNIPDAGDASQYSDTIYRSKNTALKEKSELYNLISESTPSLLYRPAIIEALKDEISLGGSKLKTETDIHGDIYKILRLGTYENIEADLSPYVDSKSTDSVSNIYCL